LLDLLILACLTSMKCYFIIVLIYISVIIDDPSHVFQPLNSFVN
jgi:hypothetical protein